MTCLRWWAFRLALLSSVTWLLPPRVLAGPPAKSVADVALDASGSLLGRVVNEHDMPEASQPVALFHQGDYLGTAVTDEGGRFSFPLNRGGVYHVSTVCQVRVIRVWTAPTAPPVARREICLSTNVEEVVRGQPGQLWRRRAVPLVTLGIAATALGLSIILPLAINGDNGEDELEPPLTADGGDDPPAS